MAKVEKKDTQLVVTALSEGELDFCLLGTAPMIMNRFQQKAWRELLLPSMQKNRAEREQTLKHVPIDEFRGGVYRNRNPREPALIHLPIGALHGALASAALDMPGATKAKIERLTRVVDVQVNLFGIPQLYMAMVRNSDINKTPDVRTRPIFPEWACAVTIRYIKTAMTERTVGNLFGGAGMIVGIGDWRPQKGGQFGTWRLVDETNADYKRIIKTQGRVAQAKALEKPTCFDPDSEELLAWFDAEVIRREREEQAGVKSHNKLMAEKRLAKKNKKANGSMPPPDVPVVVEDRHGNIVPE